MAAVTTRRRFNQSEAVALYLAADGKCELCGAALRPGWHADHMHPWARGGQTDVMNGQALCPTCNLSKGDRVVQVSSGVRLPELPEWFTVRDWQDEAFQKFRRHDQRDFLLEACPGAGKTLWSLWAVWYCLREGIAQRVVIVAPTEHLKKQWRREASKFGIHLAALFKSRNGDEAPDEHGLVVTYQQVAYSPLTFARQTARANTIVVFDEVHHAGTEKPFALGLTTGFCDAKRCLSLSGTPFRTDGLEIPFCSYDYSDATGRGRSVADHKYDYQAAVSDGVCRPVLFPALDGFVKWERDAKIFAGYLDDECTDEMEKSLLRNALNPRGKWLRDTLRDADKRITFYRDRGHAVAGGLVAAMDQGHADEIARMLEKITGVAPVVAVSDDPEASDKIARFEMGSERWLVAVRMVSEGVDIPRLRVAVYATNVLTELFFRQFMGRVCRQDPALERAQQADLFIPAVHTLQAYAERVMKEWELGIKQRKAGPSVPHPDDCHHERKPPTSDNFIGADEEHQKRVIVGGEVFGQAEVERAEGTLRDMGLEGVSEKRMQQVLVALRQRYGPLGDTGQDGRPPRTDDDQETQKADLGRAIQGRVREYVRLLEPGASPQRGEQLYRETYQRLSLATDGLPKIDRATLEMRQKRLDLIVRWIGGLKTGNQDEDDATASFG